MDAAPGMPAARTLGEETLVRGLASQFRALNVFWVVLTVLQVVSCAGIVAAAWNAYVLTRRWRVPRLIEARNPAVVGMYQNDMAWLVSFLAINLLLGGVVGAGLILWEVFFIRAKVLENKHLFSPVAHRAAR